MRERPRFRDGHRAVDVIPRDRCIRVVGYTVPIFRFEGAAKGVTGAAYHQTPEYSVLPILPVAHLAPLRKDRCAFLGGAVPRRKFLSLRADHKVKAADFFLAQGRTHIEFRRLGEPRHRGSQDRQGREEAKRTSHFVRSHRGPPSRAAWHWYEWHGRVAFSPLPRRCPNSCTAPRATAELHPVHPCNET